MDPWWMYQIKDGKVVSQLFCPSEIPEGWYDSPKAAWAAHDKPKKIDGRSKAARKMKAQADGNSSRSD